MVLSMVALCAVMGSMVALLQGGQVRRAPAPLRLHKMFADSMVLQAEAPKVYGFAPAGTKVTVAVVGNATAVAAQVAGEDGTWSALLPEQPASDPAAPRGFEISVNGSCPGCHLTLSDVLFGDVWICSGQSNMEFSVAEMFDRDRVIATAGIPGLRLFAVQKNKSNTALTEPVDLQYGQGWVRSAPETVCGAEYDNDNYTRPGNTAPYCGPHCGPSAAVHSFKRATWGYFSAVCFVHGRALLRDTGRPQGLIESCWGGSSIQTWTPGQGSNFNGMIAPLQQSPIRGVIWYQGEANANRANPYVDQMRELITAWRDGWANPAPLKNFTFILHQLSACTYGGDVPALRWSQQGAVAPWSTLPNVAMTVGLDLYDPTSPCANVHIRNKTAVGERMALAARAVSYGANIAYTGPVATGFAVSPASIVVSFAGGVRPFAFQTIAQTASKTEQGFEVLVAGVWVPVPARVVSDNTTEVEVLLAGTAEAPGAIRYAWQSIPTSQLLFDSAPVAASAGLYGLPAPPFWATCSSEACRLIAPGSVPGQPPGPSPGPPPAPGPPPVPPSPLCPQPTPVNGTCTYRNRTSFGATASKFGKINVSPNDYDACCKACKSNPKCQTAQMSHGNEAAPYDFCWLYDTPVSQLKITPTKGDCPGLELAVVPV